MPELLGICDRIYVMNEGRFVDEMPAKEATQEKIMALDHETIRDGGMKHETTPAPGLKRAASTRASARTTCATTACCVSLLLIMVFFEFITGGMLLDAASTSTNLILQNSYIVIMALGMLLVIVAGNIDLSVGSVVGFVGARRRRSLMVN